MIIVLILSHKSSFELILNSVTQTFKGVVPRPRRPLSLFTHEEDIALKFQRTFVKMFSHIWVKIRW